MEEELYESIRMDYQYIFNSRQGQNVLDDLKKVCGVDDPLCGIPAPSDRDLLVHAVWRDIYSFIEEMANSRGD